MRISDWSSDVCSSDLIAPPQQGALVAAQIFDRNRFEQILPRRRHVEAAQNVHQRGFTRTRRPHHRDEITGVDVQIDARSEEHTSELQSLMRISYAVFCLKKKKTNNNKDRK